MTSPSRRRSGISPIRDLQDRSPYKSRKLRTILQEDQLSSKITPTQTPSHRISTLLDIQNQIYKQKLREKIAQQSNSYHTYVEKSQLRRQNQYLKEKNQASYLLQIEKLRRQLELVSAENQKLRNQMAIMKNVYDKDVEAYIIEKDSLSKQVSALEQKMNQEAITIKEKYNKFAQQDISIAKQTYIQDLSKVLESLEKTKSQLIQKQNEVNSLTKMSHQINIQHSANLEYLIAENNSLKHKISLTQTKMNSQVKQAQNRKQLEKSRTQGIMTYCLESNAYMEKQVQKLAEQLIQKSISLETFTKDILKLKRNIQTNQRKYENKLTKVQEQKLSKIQEFENELIKMQKFYKEQMAVYNMRVIQLQERVATRQNQLDNIKRQLQHQKHIIYEKNQQNQQLKANLDRMHEDHAKEISKVMSQSKIGRKSMKNLSQISSLRDLSADGNNSQIKKSLLRRDSYDPAQQGSSGQLYTVHEQIAKSHILPGGSQDEDIDIQQLVLHYQNMIQQLKSNKLLELRLANDKIDQLNQSLRQKQQQLLDILERFSPLMEYKLDGKSLEEQRKQKIKKHLKADISLLGVILDKYKISGLRTKQ